MKNKYFLFDVILFLNTTILMLNYDKISNKICEIYTFIIFAIETAILAYICRLIFKPK